LVDKQLGPLEVSRGHAHVVFFLFVEELGQASVYQLQLLLLRVHEDVLRLHVAMHDSFRVTIVKGLEQLKEVQSDLEVGDRWHDALQFDVFYILEDLL